MKPKQVSVWLPVIGALVDIGMRVADRVRARRAARKAAEKAKPK